MAVSLPPLASLTLLSGNKPSMDKRSLFTVSMPSARTSTFLRTSFLGILSAPFYYPSSSLTGIFLGLDIGPRSIVKKKNWQGLLVRAGKAGLGVTRRSRSRKSLARTHGFRLRMRTPNGRKVLKRRRAKGRKVLCTKTYPSSGKRATK